MWGGEIVEIIVLIDGLEWIIAGDAAKAFGEISEVECFEVLIASSFCEFIAARHVSARAVANSTLIVKTQ